MDTKFDVTRISKQPGIAAVLCRGPSFGALTPQSSAGVEGMPPAVRAVMFAGIDMFRSCSELTVTRTRIEGSSTTVSVTRISELDEIVAVAFEDGHPVVKSLVRSIRNAAKAAIKLAAQQEQQRARMAAVQASAASQAPQPFDPEDDVDERDAVERRIDY
jgi:hypothetical protein